MTSYGLHVKQGRHEAHGNDSRSGNVHVRGSRDAGSMSAAIVRYLLTPHAIRQMERRGLDRALVADVIMRPRQRVTLRPGRDALQSLVEMDGRRYLVRVIVDVDRNPPEVVTAYRTSRIGKYWSDGP